MEDQQQTQDTTVEQTQESKITVTPPKKEKDPKRVAQGKRLAAISKEAKERKLREKIENEKLSQQYFDYTNLQKNIFLIAAPGVVFLGLYLLWANRKTNNNTVEHLSPVRHVVIEEKKQPKESSKKFVSLFDS